MQTVFDVADGTLGRLHQSSLKMSNISRIFISHMHGDHVLGLVAVLKQIMTGVGMSEDQLEALRKEGHSKKVCPVCMVYKQWCS
jgi:ribonuclease Z